MPIAIELVPTAVAAGPMATEFVPVAVESAKLELAWKYLIPAPFASAFRTLTLLSVDDRPVESEVTPLWFALIPAEADVDRDPTLLFVEDRPVERDVSLL